MSSKISVILISALVAFSLTACFGEDDFLGNTYTFDTCTINHCSDKIDDCRNNEYCMETVTCLNNCKTCDDCDTQDCIYYDCRQNKPIEYDDLWTCSNRYGCDPQF